MEKNWWRAWRAESGYALYDPQVWKHYGLPNYLVDARGRLTQLGQSTMLTAEDLVDTGRTAD